MKRNETWRWPLTQMPDAAMIALRAWFPKRDQRPADTPRELSDHDPQIVDKFLHSTDAADADGPFCDRGKGCPSTIFVSNTAKKSIAKDDIAKVQAALGQATSPLF